MCEIDSSQVLQLLRWKCVVHDGKNKYGIAESEIGARSIRSRWQKLPHSWTSEGESASPSIVESNKASTSTQHHYRRRVPNIHSLRFVIQWPRLGCGEAASVSRELARLFSHYKFEDLRPLATTNRSILGFLGGQKFGGLTRRANNPRAVEDSSKTGTDSKRSSMRSKAEHR